MVRLFSKITFQTKSQGEIVFDFLNNVEIQSSYEDLTSTAKIIIPRKLVLEDKQITDVFKRGDSVKIELGYFPELKTVFTGYITKVHNKIPIELECEDGMFLLKQKTISTYTKTTVSLKQLLADLIEDTVPYKELVQIPNIGSFRITNVSVAKILDGLRRDGIYSYFVDGVLNVGLAENATDTKEEEYKFEETIINSDSLEYYIEDDVKLKVIAKSLDFNNVKNEVTVGDEEGEVKTFYKYGTDSASLKEFANIRLKEFKYTGWRGSFSTFGEPFIRSGDRAILSSLKLPERNGKYIVKSVSRSFGFSGYKQTIEIGLKVG